jgi:hypothetical protein
VKEALSQRKADKEKSGNEKLEKAAAKVS